MNPLNSEQRKAIEDALKDTGKSLESLLKQGEDATKAADTATQNGYKEAENPRLIELESSVKALNDKFDKLMLVLSEKAAKPMEEEDEDEAKKKMDKPAEKTTATPVITDERKALLIAEMEANAQKALKDQQFKELGVSDQIMVNMGLGSLIGYEGDKR